MRGPRARPGRAWRWWHGIGMGGRIPSHGSHGVCKRVCQTVWPTPRFGGNTLAIELVCMCVRNRGRACVCTCGGMQPACAHPYGSVLLYAPSGLAQAATRRRVHAIYGALRCVRPIWRGVCTFGAIRVRVAILASSGEVWCWSWSGPRAPTRKGLCGPLWAERDGRTTGRTAQPHPQPRRVCRVQTLCK